ncbi:hypothetical protein VKT23_016181 [Stygiomarasmius scandens]|uniref:chitosanase n=1 Tax=Marasmiellus scandens TaxID=2682957 RepID=A0ABR1IYB4_9AGAR
MSSILYLGSVPALILAAPVASSSSALVRRYEAQPRRIDWHERSYVDLNENHVHRARRDVASVLSSRSDNEGPKKDNDGSGNDDLDSGNEPPKGGQNHDDANDDPDKDDSSPVSFQAASDIDVEAIYAAVKRATAKAVTEYDSGQGSKKVTIYENFMSHDGDAKAMSFIADMDVDCDGAQSCLMIFILFSRTIRVVKVILGGDKGHSILDVAYIVFGNAVPSGVDEKSSTIDLDALKQLGDKTVRVFQEALGLGVSSAQRGSKRNVRG